MRTALVTGASSGIGFATVTKFLEAGLRVVAHVRENLGELENLTQDSALHVVSADFSDLQAVSDMILDPAIQGVDILVNNAGTYNVRQDFESIRASEVEYILRVNLIAPLMLCKTLAPKMAEKEWGRIVNLSSVSVSHGGASNSVDYTVSKAAIESMTVTLAKTFTPKNVLINSVRVGATKTKIHDLNPEKNLEQRTRSIPIGRMADPKEIAEVVVFLCSTQASFISGSILAVTGGE